MKSFLIPIMMALVIWSCSPAREAARTSSDLSLVGQDSTEYEIIIVDPQFDQWYLMNFTPAKDYSDEFYRSKNITGVASWNYFYNTGKYTRIIDSYLDYRPNVEYGIELNRKLYWYFRYIEESFRIKLF
jgi:hypothetical protein